MKPDPAALSRLMSALVSFRHAKLFNPWAQTSTLDAATDAPQRRVQRLTAHLSIARPKWALIGEAAGYQGCRFSGITFTSERQLLEGSIPRVDRPGDRITTRRRPFSEPSATIVWGALHDLNIAQDVVLWNALPFHPFEDGDPLSNRAPSGEELRLGSAFLDLFLSLYPGVPVIAVGRKAQTLLKEHGTAPAACIRHPANGGASQFRRELAAFVASC